ELIAKLTNGSGPIVSEKPPAVAVAPAQTLPDAPAKTILEANCTTCHTLDRVKSKHFDKESWQGVIESMRGKRGGPKDLTDDDIQVLVDYLSKNFGPAAQ